MSESRIVDPDRLAMDRRERMIESASRQTIGQKKEKKNKNKKNKKKHKKDKPMVILRDPLFAARRIHRKS